MVTAATLGYSVDFVDITDDGGEIGFRLEKASAADIGSICGAGFAMERILGRMHDQAWKRCEGDRTMMSTLVADITGVTLDTKAADAQFLAGAEASTLLINNKATRRAIDDLADILSDLYLGGTTRLNSPSVCAPTAA